MKYIVNVVRMGIGYTDIEVEADSEEEAEETALDLAGDYNFSEKDADYSVSHIYEKNSSPLEITEV